MYQAGSPGTCLIVLARIDHYFSHNVPSCGELFPVTCLSSNFIKPLLQATLFGGAEDNPSQKVGLVLCGVCPRSPPLGCPFGFPQSSAVSSQNLETYRSDMQGALKRYCC